MTLYGKSKQLADKIGMIQHEHGVLMILNTIMGLVLLALIVVWLFAPTVVIVGIPGTDSAERAPINWKGR